MTSGISTLLGDNQYTLDIDQYGTIKSIVDNSGIVLIGSPLKKRPENSIAKYGYWWCIQGATKFDSPPGCKEEKQSDERSITRTGCMGSEEYRMQYSEKIIFNPGGSLEFSCEALFEKTARWTYPLVITFTLSSKLVGGRGYLATNFTGTKEKGIIPSEGSGKKEQTLRKIRNLGFSTKRGVVYFYAADNTEIWLILKDGTATIQVIPSDYPLWQEQIIQAGDKKGFSFKLLLPGAVK